MMLRLGIAFFLIALVRQGICAWQFPDHLSIKSVQCHEHHCNISMDIRADYRDNWSPVLAIVTMGHTDKIDDGKIEIYDMNSGSPTVTKQNIYFGSILSLPMEKKKNLGCSGYDRGCLFEVCISRGYSEIIKGYNEKGEEEIWIHWTPMITFTELWFGPRIKFSYAIKYGKRTDLTSGPYSQFWGECHKPDDPYDNSYFFHI